MEIPQRHPCGFEEQVLAFQAEAHLDCGRVADKRAI